MDEAILMSYLKGECNDQEAQLVEQWSEKTADNHKLLEQLYYTSFIGNCLSSMQRVDTEAALKRLKLEIKSNATQASEERVTPWTKSETRGRLTAGGEGTPRKDIKTRQIRWYSIAAAFLAGLILAGAVTWRLLSGKETSFTVMTSAGQRTQTLLPDGSKVWLNASTQLTYRSSALSSLRQVDLSGEAYFEVTPDKHAPFVIHSKNIKTTVLGTKFNVRAREQENKVITTLFEGTVRVESPENQLSDNKYLMKPGQTLHINTDSYMAEWIEYSQPEKVLLWVNGRLIFKQHSLLEITDIMERLYDVTFIYDDDSLKSKQFTGEFSTDETPSEILNVLQYTNHFTYREEGNTIHLFKK